MSSNARRALVVGGSIGGLIAGHLLLRSGWDVTIVERSAADLADRGAGLGISEELLNVMRGLGIRMSRSSALYVPNAIWLDQEGKIRFESPRSNFGSTWSLIYGPLRSTFPDSRYRSGMSLSHIEHVDRGAIAVFSDGGQERVDLLIGADGAFSTVRRQLLPAVEPKCAGYVAWRGLIDERDLPPGSPPFLLERYAFSFPEGEFAISLPVPGPNNDQRPGHRRYYFIWYRPTDEQKRLALFTDEDGHSHGISIPPPRIRTKHIAEMREAAQKNLSPILANIVGQVRQPLLQSITDMESTQLVFGRVILLGDSAFIARPHVVAGATKAALDARDLVDVLEASAGDIDGALARYERIRREFGQAIVGYSRYLGAYLEGQLKPPADRIASARN
jgi:2-polyprenyl-6-methoxyphenol hydroxylase-like FAD-dependent oxidoreductase